MLVRFPCPKCREPMIIGVTKCPSCSYRVMSWETRRARWISGLTLLMGVFMIGALIYVVSQR